MSTLSPFTIKCYQDAQDLFKKLQAESEAPTAGKFFETLLENWENPRGCVIKDTPTTIARLEKAEEDLLKLQQDNEDVLLQNTRLASAVSMYEETFKAIDAIFRPYLTIAKRDGHAKDYSSLFKAMLNTIHELNVMYKQNAWTLSSEDVEYLKNNKNE